MPSNISLLYSFSILSVFFVFIIYKRAMFVAILQF